MTLLPRYSAMSSRSATEMEFRLRSRIFTRRMRVAESRNFPVPRLWKTPTDRDSRALSGDDSGPKLESLGVL